MVALSCLASLRETAPGCRRRAARGGRGSRQRRRGRGSSSRSHTGRCIGRGRRRPDWPGCRSWPTGVPARRCGGGVPSPSSPRRGQRAQPVADSVRSRSTTTPVGSPVRLSRWSTTTRAPALRTGFRGLAPILFQLLQRVERAPGRFTANALPDRLPLAAEDQCEGEHLRHALDRERRLPLARAIDRTVNRREGQPEPGGVDHGQRRYVLSGPATTDVRRHARRGRCRGRPGSPSSYPLDESDARRA